MKRILLFLALASCALAGTWVASPGKGAHASATTPLKTNLVSYFQMDEASGDLLDVHGSKTFTQTLGTISSVSGVISTARSSPGTNPYGTRADDTSFEPGSSPFFVTMWVKPGSLTQASFPSLIGKWTQSGSQDEWTILFLDDTNGLELTTSSDGASNTASLDVTAIFSDTTTWKFIAAGWDGTNLKLSVNGGAFSTTAYAGPVFNGTSVVQIFSRNAAAGTAFAGALDEVAFWKGRALTLAEVQTIYNSGAGKAYSTW